MGESKEGETAVLSEEEYLSAFASWGLQCADLRTGEQKKLVMEDKYGKMGKRRLEKLLERKRKKKEQKELRRMPRQR